MPGHIPSLVTESLWQTPQASTLTRTEPALGSGIARSTISKGPFGRVTCATRIFDIAPPIVCFLAPSLVMRRSNNDLSNRPTQHFFLQLKSLLALGYFMAFTTSSVDGTPCLAFSQFDRWMWPNVPWCHPRNSDAIPQ